MPRAYLAVSFAKKDEAKALGAKWDAMQKRWYAPFPDKQKELIEMFPRLSAVALVGEDRAFAGNDLHVDLVPKSCWFNNVRTCVAESDWECLRHMIYERANNTCETCGLVCNRGVQGEWLEAHERWSYDDKSSVQRLERLVALCHSCHMATHMGFAEVKGVGDQARAHLKKVRRFTDAEVDRHIQDAFAVWKKRNQKSWTLDVSVITLAGIQIKSPLKD